MTFSCLKISKVWISKRSLPDLLLYFFQLFFQFRDALLLRLDLFLLLLHAFYKRHHEIGIADLKSRIKMEYNFLTMNRSMVKQLFGCG